MAAVATPTGFRDLRWWHTEPGCRAVVSLSGAAQPRMLTRLVTAGTVAYCLVFPLLQIGVIASYSNSVHDNAVWAALATAAFLPFYLRHILYFIRGLRAPAAGWTLAAMAVLIIGATPLAGSEWLPTYFALAVATLIVLPWRWSLPGLAVLAAMQVLFALALPVLVPSPAAYFVTTLLWRTSGVFVPVWLVSAVRQLERARRELAEDAVLRERQRVDAELRDTLGTALASIVARGQRSAALAGKDPGAAGPQLAALVEMSRGTLADTRRLLSGYHQPSLWAELETAASLLAAAGISTRLALPAGDPPDIVDAEFRSGLRATTARLLRDESARSCVIAVRSDGGQMRLDVTVDDRHLASMAVSAS
jgi:two-component system, NarL family, sensor histidine kinase DesK